MVAPKKEEKDQILKKWIDEEFVNKSTKEGYLSALRKFKKNLGIEDLGEHLKNDPDATADIKRFLISLEGKPGKTKAAYVAAVKSFFRDHNVSFDNNGMMNLKKRGFMPRNGKAETRDKSPTKTQLKQILNYLDVKGRAMVLFLVSSGARIGETLQLKKEDFELDAKPPKVSIRDEYTKKGSGGRTAYFSYEARDAIKDWLKIKETLRKRRYGSYSGDRVFSFSDDTARFMWNRACDKAGISERDSRTKRRLYHIHSLRKFFRTNARMSFDFVNALMGHKRYLDSAYLRLEETGEIAAAYLVAMPNVSVYQVEDQELKQETASLREENEDLKKRVKQLESKENENLKIKNEFGALKNENSKTKEEMKQLSLKFNSIVEKLEKLLELSF